MEWKVSLKILNSGLILKTFTHAYLLSGKYIWASMQENLTLMHKNNNSADLPGHPRSLISTLLIHYVESIVL